MQTLLDIPRDPRALTPEQLVDASAALAVLEGSAITLLEAAQVAVNCPRVLRRVGFTAAVDEFVRSRLLAGRKRASVDWYDLHLRRMADALGTRNLDTITRAELQAELEAVFPTRPARAGAARACRALWRWAMRCEPAIAGADITIGMEFKVTAGSEASSSLPA